MLCAASCRSTQAKIPPFAEIFEFVQRIDAAGQRHARDLAVASLDFGAQALARLLASGPSRGSQRLVTPTRRSHRTFVTLR